MEPEEPAQLDHVARSDLSLLTLFATSVHATTFERRPFLEFGS